ncbi:MAG: hypothetical protein IJ717_05805 [Treponema sp.]|nr:hypothetical protein [Treponema sp.]DAG30147.1 MAG TPA: hypothetical protein [Caudoviricetes sp.]
MTLDTESQHKESLDVFIRSLQAAPDSLIKSLTGKEFARHIIDGAKEIEQFIYSQDEKKK